MEIAKNRFICIIRNIRNNNSKSWNKRTPNLVLIRDYFGVGSTKAHEWCNYLKIDPDGFSAEFMSAAEAVDE